MKRRTFLAACCAALGLPLAKPRIIRGGAQQVSKTLDMPQTWVPFVGGPRDGQYHEFPQGTPNWPTKLHCPELHLTDWDNPNAFGDVPRVRWHCYRYDARRIELIYEGVRT